MPLANFPRRPIILARMRQGLFAAVCLVAACSSGPEPDVKSPYPYGRYLGALKAAERPNAENVKIIVGLLEDPEYLVRCGAVVALGRIGRKEFLQHLAPRLDPKVEASAMVRSDACLAVAQIKNPAGLPALAAVLQSDPEPVVRRDAAKAIATFGKKPEVLQALAAAVGDADVSVAWRSHVSLQELTGAKDVAMTRDAWAAWLKDHP